MFFKAVWGWFRLHQPIIPERENGEVLAVYPEWCSKIGKWSMRLVLENNVFELSSVVRHPKISAISTYPQGEPLKTHHWWSISFFCRSLLDHWTSNCLWLPIGGVILPQKRQGPGWKRTMFCNKNRPVLPSHVHIRQPQKPWWTFMGFTGVWGPFGGVEQLLEG